MRPISPSRRCRNTYAQALERRCFSNDTSGGNRKSVLLFTLEAQSKDHKLCAAATVEPPRKKSSPTALDWRILVFQQIPRGRDCRFSTGFASSLGQPKVDNL